MPEWVTVRTLRFVNKNQLHCESCVFRSELTRAEFSDIKMHMKSNDSIDVTPIHMRLMKRIEAEQLASKPPLQLELIRRSMAAERSIRNAWPRTPHGRTCSHECR